MPVLATYQVFNEKKRRKKNQWNGWKTTCIIHAPAAANTDHAPA